jgi:rSAM/selenodomain-associated transferase 2
MSSPVAVIIPTLNEERVLGRTLAAVAGSSNCELIVVDGGSSDDTVAIARAAGAKIVESPRGRGRQMNAGAAAASAATLLFLHADTLLPADFPQLIHAALSKPGVAAGAFSLAIDSEAKSLATVAFFANLRSRFLHMPYGDQALFTTRRMFAAVGGYPEMAIMEDFVLVRQLQKRGRIVILPEKAVTSARRWRNIGPLRTTLINQVIVCGYILGVPSTTLAGWYQRLRGVANS